jgi:hypothetical protein
MEDIYLQFLPKQIVPSVPKNIDAYDVLKKLSLQKHKTIKLNWYDLFEDVLFVEDDALFLTEAYNELSEIGEQDAQNIFLGDGSLQIDINFRYDEVHMTVIHSPNLDKRFSQKKEVKIARDDYYLAWKCLMKQVLDFM